MSDPKKGSKESEDPMLKLAAMIKSLENKIQQSEVRTATKINSKIDGLVESLTKRMDRTEAELVTLNVNLAQAQSDIEDMREMASGSLWRRRSRLTKSRSGAGRGQGDRCALIFTSPPTHPRHGLEKRDTGWLEDN